MKVLHLPVNIASQASVIVNALCDIGVDARVLVKSENLMHDLQGVNVLPPVTARRGSMLRIYQKMYRWKTLLREIRWADVVHWHSSSHIMPMEFDLLYTALLKKVRLVEFWGTDTRIPSISITDNPYIEKMYQSYSEELEEGKHKSLKTQRKFCRYGFECILSGYTHHRHIQREYFPTIYHTNQRINLSNYTTCFPSVKKKVPLLVHIPSKKLIKGTDAVLKAINQLKSSLQFEFSLIENVSHQEALDRIKECDIMIDQLVVGEHGVATIEAMAFGKPTICYIQPSFVSAYPADLPIVNANQENLAEILSGLIQDGQKRHEIGRQGRQYVEKYHDAHKVARDLVKIYEQLIHQKQAGRGVTNHRKDV